MPIAGIESSLPRPLTSLIGREADVRAVANALVDGTTRLLTITGPGGVGKSRIALDVAHQVAGSFPGGVHLIEAASLTDPELLVPVLARALDQSQVANIPSVATLARIIGDQSLLLVLDDFDHLTAHALPLAELLRHCAGLRCLVTSRSRLRLRGEVVWSIPPLPPPAGGVASAEHIAENAAIRLFVERGREADPSFALSATNASAIAEIVRRLEGLPLAIELAAARLDLLPPSALLARLNSQLPLLSSGLRDLPDRQQAMAATIAWSYDLLTPDEQRLLEAMALFPDTIPLSGAVAAAGAGDELEVLDLLGRLVERSVLARETGDTPEPRFRMLQIVREYVRQRLTADGRETETMARVAAWGLEVAAVMAAHREHQGATADLIARMTLEEGLFREILAWLEAQADDERFVQLAADLSWWWLQRSFRQEGRRWLEAAVMVATKRGMRTAAAARALTGAAVLAFLLGDLNRGRAYAHTGMQISRELGDQWGVAASLNLLGAIARAGGNFVEAKPQFAEALQGFEALNEPGWVALASLNLGTIAYWQHDPALALSLMTRALEQFRRLDEPYGLAITTNDLARVHADLGEVAQAAEWFLQSISQWQRVGTREGMIDWLTRVATLAAVHGQPDQAMTWFAAAEQMSAALGYVLDVPERLRQRPALEHARLAIGAERAEAAWIEGRSTPLEDAIQRARIWLASSRVPAEAERGPVPLPVQDGPNGLTPREMDVLVLLVEGLSDRQIGERLYISHRTVMRHVESILGKLGVESRTGAATLAVRQGIVSL